jgi:hypothetical protein
MSPFNLNYLRVAGFKSLRRQLSFFSPQRPHSFEFIEALETKQYCSAAFLDISQAFDKVWHTGLLYKLRLALPLNYFLLLKSYLLSRHFLVKVGTDHSALTSINAGVPQGSVLGPLLYLFYTADLPA